MEQFGAAVELIQLRGLVKLEELLDSEIKLSEEKGVSKTPFNVFLKGVYETVLTQSEKCSYNPLINLQIQIVKNTFDNYQKLYQ